MNRRLKLVDSILLVGEKRSTSTIKPRLCKKAQEMFDEQQLDVIQQVVDRTSVQAAIEELKRHNAVLDSYYYKRQLRRLQEELESLNEKPTGKGNVEVNITLG